MSGDEGRLRELLTRLQDRDLEVLRKRWDEGKASGTAGPFDIERLIEVERDKLKSGGGDRTP
ncbi:MAG: hypothetical protein EXQ92_04995 [Alphaproteobacteria bacterium]|nr:hypothetical protein [Alphaproteobacteria bacterium]